MHFIANYIVGQFPRKRVPLRDAFCKLLETAMTRNTLAICRQGRHRSASAVWCLRVASGLWDGLTFLQQTPFTDSSKYMII